MYRLSKVALSFLLDFNLLLNSQKKRGKNSSMLIKLAGSLTCSLQTTQTGCNCTRPVKVTRSRQIVCRGEQGEWVCWGSGAVAGTYI